MIENLRDDLGARQRYIAVARLLPADQQAHADAIIQQLCALPRLDFASAGELIEVLQGGASEPPIKNLLQDEVNKAT